MYKKQNFTKENVYHIHSIMYNVHVFLQQGFSCVFSTCMCISSVVFSFYPVLFCSFSTKKWFSFLGGKPTISWISFLKAGLPRSTLLVFILENMLCRVKWACTS